MKKKILLLGSTGSIGRSSLNIIRNYKSKLEIVALSTNKNIRLITKQSKEFKVKNLIINDFESYKKILNYNLNKKIRIFNKISDFLKINKKKFDITIVGISGFDGLDPTLKVIPYSKNLSSANKESIICGWKFINNKLNKYKTNFIPLDSEHFSVWSLIKNSNHNMISKIYLTASGGPFLNKSKNKINNAKISDVIKHPNWNMGHKISVDSATLMNKLFELIEASKIFNLPINKFDIVIHPKSYVHALVNFKNGLSKILIHDTQMEIPIFNSIFYKTSETYKKNKDINFKNLNGENFIKPSVSIFPFLRLIKKLKRNDSYYEIILVTVNDYFVKKFLSGNINFQKMQIKLLKKLKDPYLAKYYNKHPKKINDIYMIVDKVKKYLNEKE
ncbi:1-deoxy-D-xylulose-5-phosphate reductoisomerase [Candidatus Pelagibacter sp.]|nr:1-deoxy-D-xylulose-5-phosphate reductoisomerase [Candidatus Pelagibacter sp.]